MNIPSTTMGFVKFSFNFLCLTVLFFTSHVHLKIFESECVMLTFKTICLGHTIQKVNFLYCKRNMLVWPSWKDLHTYNYRGQPKAGTGYKMLFVPFVFSMSRFQGPSFRCNRIVVIVTLLEAIEGIPDSTKIIIFEGTKTSTIFTRDYFMSENLRVDI